MSHGEVDIQNFPKYLANHVLCIAVAFCLRFCSENISGIDCSSRKDGFSGKDGFSEIDRSSWKDGFSEKENFSEHSSKMDSFSEISKTVQDYRSIFHPFSCFRRELSSLIWCLLEWKNLTQPSEDEFQENCSEDLYNETGWERIINKILQQTSLAEKYTSREEKSICDEQVLKMMLRLLEESEMDTLFRPRYELETASLLRQVVGNCLQTSDQVS